MTPEEIESLPYRPCVGVMLVNGAGHVFVGQRNDTEAPAWQMPQGVLTLAQEFQVVSGTLGSTTLTDAKLRGEEITFTIGDAVYNGRVQGDNIRGTVTGGSGGAFTATKQ